MRPTFRPRTVLLFSLAVTAAAVLSFRGIYEPDLWWHLAHGREDAAGRLVHSNVFSFIYPTFPQPYTPWLFDLGGYLAWQAARGTGIQLAQAAWLTLTFVLVYFACQERVASRTADINAVRMKSDTDTVRLKPDPTDTGRATTATVRPKREPSDTGRATTATVRLKREPTDTGRATTATVRPKPDTTDTSHATVAAAVAVLVLGFFVIEPRAIPRPHLVTLAGLAACSLFIERARRTRSAAPLRWTMPVVAGWSNMHVECIFGVLLAGVFACGELVRPSTLSRREARRAIAIAAGCAAATLANPYGWGLATYLYENWHVPQMLAIAELQPPYLPAYRAFFAYLAIAAALLPSRPRSVALWEVAAAAVFAVLGVKFLRFTPLVFIVTAPVLAGRVAWLIERGVDGRAIVVTAIAIGLVTSRPSIRTLTHLSAGTRAVAPPSFFSPGLARFARTTGLYGPVFNSMNLGGYLAWELYPDTRIFQDGRLQAVPPAHFRRILEASRSQAEWDALVAGVDWAVLSNPRPDQLSGAGRFTRADWATIYWDEAVEVLVRRSGRFAALVQPYEYTLLLPSSDAQVAARQLEGPDGARLRAEARRNMTENPEGPVAAAVLCAAGDGSACAAKF